jgi:hypothetical protein
MLTVVYGAGENAVISLQLPSLLIIYYFIINILFFSRVVMYTYIQTFQVPNMDSCEKHEVKCCSGYILVR